MGAVDVARQAPNVARMKVLGTEIVAVQDGQKTLKEAVDAALKAFAEQPDTFYLLGSAVGPHPYPTMVRDFQSIIGKEARSQFLEREQKLPDYAIACVGGGSNAIGLFSGFLDDSEVKIIGVEPAEKALLRRTRNSFCWSAKHYPWFQKLRPSKENGESAEVYSISAGLDYPGVGPEHAYLKDIGRVDYKSVTDEEAIDAFKLLSNKEGIIPALESSHALAYAFKLLPALAKDQTVLVNLSGRGDKDMDTVLPLLV